VNRRPLLLSAFPAASLLSVLLLLLPVWAQDSRAQETASIEGSRLQPIATLDQEVGNALGDLLNTKPEGKVGRVTVTRERAASLQLTVEYDGFAGNWLKGQVLRAGSDGDPEPIVEIVVEPVELEGSGQVTIEFKLDDDVEEGASFGSSHLVLLVTKRVHNRAGAKSTFVLQKSWDSATRAENIEVVVRARALQDLGTGFKRAPEQGSRPQVGPSDDEVNPQYVRLRAGAPNNYRYLSADDGGGASVRLQSSAGDSETFQLGWIDEDEKIGRLRTANGWHLLAIRPDGRVDAVSADPTDPATVLQLQYNGDGTYIVHAADAATARRVTGTARPQRRGVLGNMRQRAAQRAAQRRAPASSSSRLTIYRSGGGVTARTSGSKRDAAFYFELNAPIPRDIGRPGQGEGPARDPEFDLEGIPVMQGYLSGRTADEGPDIEDLLGIDSQIWADEDRSSGVYYFIPSAYHLKWDPDKDYDLSLNDEMAEGEGEQFVLVRARLAPRFTQAQRRAAEILVGQAARDQGMPFFELRQMPVAGEATTSTAPEALAGHHDIDNVVVHPPTDAMGEVEISWRMRAATRESFVELLRQDQAVAPQLLLRPSSDNGGLLRIPLYMSWEEPGSYPPILWENGSFQRNEIPHPIRLRGLHAMVLDRDERVQVLSWDLTNTAPIPSRARAAMGQALTQPVIDNAFLTWVDYAVVPDDASTEAAVRAITGGVSEQVRQPLEILLFDPLEASGARQLTVLVMSKYFEAGADKTIARQFSFTEDGETRSVPFYLGRADDEVPFQWTVRLTMPDGQEHERSVFLDGDIGLRLLVSSSSLRQIFGNLPPGGTDQ